MLTVEITAPNFAKNYKCKSVVFFNGEREVEILPGHSKLISAIGNNWFRITDIDDKKETFKAVDGMIDVVEGDICNITATVILAE